MNLALFILKANDIRERSLEKEGIILVSVTGYCSMFETSEKLSLQCNMLHDFVET